jgi:hypothetical protein
MRELWEADLRATAGQRAIPVPQLYIRERRFQYWWCPHLGHSDLQTTLGYLG